MRIIAISDTHGLHEALAIPEGDVLVHAGDVTSHGAVEELVAFNEFLGRLPHRYKLVIAGNHDWCFEQQPELCARLLTNAIYLQDAAITIEGVKFYGSPWQPWFMDWAFNLPRGPELARRWARIPEDTDILITHGPPLGFGDRVGGEERVGCEDLLRRVREVRPKLHLFGHIHEDGGLWAEGATTFVNVTSDYCMRAPQVLRYPPA